MSNKTTNISVITVNVDGACEPVNPGGITSYGIVVRGENRVLTEGNGIVGKGEGMTNNVAEYTAATEVVKWAGRNLDPSKLELRSDSQLLVKQIGGEYSVKSPRIQPLYSDLLAAIDELDADFEAKWIPRERNERADALSKEAIDDYVETHDYRYNGHPLGKCDECGAWMVVREGKYGKFYGCSRYPKCKNTKSLDEVEGK